MSVLKFKLRAALKSKFLSLPETCAYMIEFVQAQDEERLMRPKIPAAPFVSEITGVGARSPK